MRVLYVSSEGRMAGAEHSLLLLLHHLHDRLEAVVACPWNGELCERCQAQHVACQPILPIHGGGTFSRRQYLRAAWCVRCLAKRLRPDIIHANNLHAMAICSVARGAGGSKLVWHARDLPRKRLVERWCGGRAHRIIAVSHAVKDLLLTSGSDEEKVDVVYNGVDPPAEPMPVAGSNDCFTFANVGQLVEWKNQEDFLAAAELVHARLPRTRFLLVGSNVFDRNGRYESKLKARIKTRQMSYVQPMGWKTDMKPVWEQTDCLVHTALREPFGRVLIEAMAHGRPVVAFASGGPAEVVADGRTGLLAPFGDVRTLSEAMLRVAQEPGLAAAMGRAARRRADEHFSARCTADAVMSVYNKVLNGC